MLSEQLLRFFSTFLVGIYIARELGPEDFGVLSYSLAIITIAGAFSRLGLDAVLVRDFANRDTPYGTLLGSAMALGLASAIFCAGFVAFFVFSYESDNLIRYIVLILSLGLIFNGFSVIEFMFQGRGLARYSSTAKILALLVSAAIKLWVVISGLDLVYLAAAYLFETVLVMLGLILALLYDSEISRLKVSSAVIANLAKQSIPLIIVAGSSVLYMRIDQVMIKYMLGANELGIYVAAIRLFEGWMILPMVVSVSLMSRLVPLMNRNNLEFIRQFSVLVSVLFWIGIVIFLMSFFYSEKIIVLFFGEAFSSASQILWLVMLSAPLTAINSIAARYCVIKGLGNTLALRAVLALLVNIVANILFIPTFGIIGAAFSTLLSLFIGSYLPIFFDRNLKELKRIIHNGILLRGMTVKSFN